MRTKARCKFCKNMVTAFDSESIRYHLDPKDGTPCPGVEYKPRCCNVDCTDVPTTYVEVSGVEYLICTKHTTKPVIPNAELVS